MYPRGLSSQSRDDIKELRGVHIDPSEDGTDPDGITDLVRTGPVLHTVLVPETGVVDGYVYGYGVVEG